METPNNLRYTKEHEWIIDTGSQLKVGITDYAQHELGDVVFVDLPKVGSSFHRGQPFASVESVKAVSDVYAPVDGKVVAVNEKLLDSPELVNKSAFKDGWFITLEVTNSSQLAELMDAKSYGSYIAELAK